MLATVTLATREGWLGTWLGSTLGMVLADALAIAVGALLGRQLPERVVRYVAAAAFLVFGLLLIADGAGLL
jgi:Ca2+/H+ antiporter, TMEM165/GDT1 family